jgi:ABC-type phosphate transport system substrate-binding protein
MLRRVIGVAVLAILLIGCVGGATGSPPNPGSPGAVTPSGTPAASASAFTLADLPRIDGSTANIPLISLVIQRLTGVSATEADNAVETSGTPLAYRNLISDLTDLLLVYEADQGTLALIKESGVKLELHPLGRDALVFFTNSSNPVTSLTTAQFRKIYTGGITNWSQVGGRDAEIIAYQRPEESGSQALLRKFVVGKATMAKAPSERISGEMGEIIDAVAGYANSGNAMGYSVYYYLTTMYSAENIRMLAAAGVAPSSQTIADGSYPYTNDFFAVVRADSPAGSPARRVLEWLLSDEGRQAVSDAGYVAVKG